MELNYLGIVVAAVAGFLTGMAWFSPYVFGKQWAALAHIKMDPNFPGSKMAKIMAAAFVSQLILAYVLSVCLYFLGGYDIVSGLSVAFWMWLGFVATIQLGIVLWEQKPFKLYAIRTSAMAITHIVTSQPPETIA
jgi:hypothetical protein